MCWIKNKLKLANKQQTLYAVPASHGVVTELIFGGLMKEFGMKKAIA